MMDIVILFSSAGGKKAVSSSLANQSLCIQQLQHPKHGEYLCLYHEKQWFELQSCSLRKYNTYFIDQRVCNSPYLYLATPIDMKFLLLPYLEKAKTQYSPLDQIIPTSSNLLGYLRDPLEYTHWNLELICDVNTSFGEDCPMFRYSAEKTMTWLQRKVQKLGEKIRQQRITKEQKQNPSFVSSFNFNSASDADLAAKEDTTTVLGREDLLVAVEVICDYLSEELANTLLKSYGLTTADFNSKNTPAKRKADWEVALEQEKEEVLYQPAATSTVVSNAEKKVEKLNFSTNGVHSVKKVQKLNEQAAKGTKSIQSFFTMKK